MRGRHAGGQNFTWYVSWLMLSVVLAPTFALLARHLALAWPLVGHSCAAGSENCTFPRPEWRTPFVASVSGTVIGLLIAVTASSLVRWRKPLFWAGACVPFGAVVGLFAGVAAQSNAVELCVVFGALGGLVVGGVVAALWYRERWASNGVGRTHAAHTRP